MAYKFRIIKIPNYSVIKGLSGRSPFCYPSQRQDTIPHQKVGPVLGIRSGEKVLFFAGGFGDWARAIADEKVEVHYTDVLKQVVGWMKRSKRKGGVASVRTKDAVWLPEERCDWVVSFEPVPLTGRALPITMLRALVKSKGMKLVYSPSGRNFFPEPWRILRRLLNTVKAVYDVGVEKKTPKIRSSDRDGVVGEIRHIVFSVYTNPEARRKAEIDLEVIGLLQPRKRDERVVSRQTAVKTIMRKLSHLNATESEIREAINRIRLFTKKVYALEKEKYLAQAKIKLN
ncbi:hypothetical protein HY991_01275 [Candidatus Micrarchaeota archaeon]|nr:hypothetical protein [Candidatus Micrarchaeota archaeon]